MAEIISSLFSIAHVKFEIVVILNGHEILNSIIAHLETPLFRCSVTGGGVRCGRPNVVLHICITTLYETHWDTRKLPGRGQAPPVLCTIGCRYADRTG